MTRFVIAALAAIAPLGCSMLLADDIERARPATPGSADFGSGSSGSSSDGGTIADGPDSSATGADGASPNDAYGAAVLSDGPVAFWRRDDESGPVVRDAMGRRDLTLDPDGVHVFRVPGKGSKGFAIRFVESYGATAEDVIAMGASDRFTVEGWVRSTQTNDHYDSFFEQGTGSGRGRFGAYFWINPSRVEGGGLERWNGGDYIDGVFIGSVLPNDRFVHLVVTQGESSYQLFVDGVRRSKANRDERNVVPSNKLVWAKELKGELDDLAVYDKELTEERVAAHFAAAR